MRPGDFTSLLNDILTACKKISCAVNRGGLIGILGSAETENVQGETQKKLDIISNDVMVNALDWTGHLAGMASEEMEDPLPIPEMYPRGKYLILFDPLDGSSNIDVNLSVGTIFSILRCPEGVENPGVRGFPAAWYRASVCRLRIVWSIHHAGINYRARCKRIHAGSQYW